MAVALAKMPLDLNQNGRNCSNSVDAGALLGIPPHRRLARPSASGPSSGFGDHFVTHQDIFSGTLWFRLYLDWRSRCSHPGLPCQVLAPSAPRPSYWRCLVLFWPTSWRSRCSHPSCCPTRLVFGWSRRSHPHACRCLGSGGRVTRTPLGGLFLLRSRF